MTAQGGVRGNKVVAAHAAVMTDRGVRPKNVVVLNMGAGLDHATGKNQIALAHHAVAGHVGPFGNDVRQLQALPLHLVERIAALTQLAVPQRYMDGRCRAR